MRGKGINYDTGFSPGGRLSREDFDAGVVRRAMRSGSPGAIRDGSAWPASSPPRPASRCGSRRSLAS
jgi:hypothetical protein